MTFDEWWRSEAEFDAPEAVGRETMGVIMELARAAWDAATAAERDRQEQHRADVRNYLKAPLEEQES